MTRTSNRGHDATALMTAGYVPARVHQESAGRSCSQGPDDALAMGIRGWPGRRPATTGGTAGERHCGTAVDRISRSRSCTRAPTAPSRGGASGGGSPGRRRPARAGSSDACSISARAVRSGVCRQTIHTGDLRAGFGGPRKRVRRPRPGDVGVVIPLHDLP
jgi:hypothetical protein